MNLSRAIMGPRGWRRTAGVLALAAAGAVGGSPALGQDAPAPAPALPEASPAAVVVGGQGLRLQFHDANINTVLDELSAAAGYVVVKEVKPEGRVTLVSQQPVDGVTAIALLNTVLRNQGYAAIAQGRILKIVRADQAKKMGIPVRVGNDPAQIEPGDELITQVIPLRFADATQLKQDLAPLMNPGADFASNQSSNALVMTDTASNVRRIVQIVAALDTSIADAVDVRVFALKYASAASAAKLITDVFANIDVSGQQQADMMIPPWRRPRQEEANRQQQGSRPQVKVSASADERTNSVVVSGPADSLNAIAKIIQQLDANPAAEESVFVYRLRNAQAVNLETVVNSLFNATAAPTRSGTQNPTLDRGTRTGNSGSSVSGAFGSTSGRLAQSTSSRFGAQQTNSQQTSTPRLSPQAQQAASDLAGKISIIADTDTNSLLVRASPAHYDRVKVILEELDKPVAQVLIKVLIAEVTHDNGLDLGTEFSILNIRPSGLGQEGGTSFNIPTMGAAASGMVVQIMEENFTATIRALETEGKLDVLSRPYILASDNQLASITVGQEVPFITNSRITDDGQTINTIQYGDVGILLDVVPHINPDGLVILEVAPEISTLTGDTVPISELVSAPVIAKRSAFTRVGVTSGQTVVIGGLMEDRVTVTVNKVPFLGDIPLLGYAFKRTQNKKSKTELLIFLTPHVATDPNLLKEMAKDEVEGTRLLPGAVAPGVYDTHREGLQRGSTTAPAPAAEEAKDEP